MLDLVLYEAGPGGYLHERHRITNMEHLYEVRESFLEMWEATLEAPEWNVKRASCSFTLLVGHIWGYCRDEHYLLCVEDKGATKGMATYNELLEVGKFDPVTMAPRVDGPSDFL